MIDDLWYPYGCYDKGNEPIYDIRQERDLFFNTLDFEINMFFHPFFKFSIFVLISSLTINRILFRSASVSSASAGTAIAQKSIKIKMSVFIGCLLCV